MNNIFVILLSCIALGVYGQIDWNRHVKFSQHEVYFKELMEELVSEIEEMGWWNLKLQNVTKSIDTQLYDWHFNANVTYANGFVISIQKIDIDNIRQVFLHTSGSIMGHLNFRDITLGWDLIVEMPHETQFYTAKYTHRTITYDVQITKDLITNVTTTSCRIISHLAGAHPVEIRPQNSVTEAVSRNFLVGDSWNSASEWGTKIINPLVLELATTKIPLPISCFYC